MSYLAIKHIHMTFAALSGTLFFLRGLWMLRESPLLQKRWIARSSYVIDTMLLGSAIVMMVWSAQYPLVQQWLTVKVLAVIAYIVAGAIALKRGRTRGARIGAFVIALLLLAYIVKLALTRQLL